ncbi:MAG: ArnT family glycosyltransferase [Phycisphaerales bacterium]
MPRGPHRGPRRGRAWRRDGILAAGLVVLAIGLRLAGPDDLWDHAQPRTMAYAVDMVANGRWILPFDAEGHPATKPPLVPWLAAPAVAVLGPSGRVVHLIPSLGAVLLTVAALWWAGRRWWPRAAADTGAVAVILWISSPLAGRTLVLARPDMVLTAAITVGWLAATIMVVERPRAGELGRTSRRRWLQWGTYVGAAAASTLAKGPAALPLIVAAPAGAWLVRRATWPSPFGLGGPATLAAILLPFAIWWNAAAAVDLTAVVRDVAGGEVFDRMRGAMPETRDAGPIRLLTTAGHLPAYLLARHAPWSLVLLAALALHLRPGWARRPVRSNRAGRIATTMGLALIVATIAVFTLGAGKRADYLAPCLPAASLIAAAWLTSGDRRWHVRTPWLVPALAAALLAAAAVHARRPSNGIPAAAGPHLAAAVRAAMTEAERSGLPIITLGSAEPSLAVRLGRVPDLDLGRHAALVAAGQPHILVHADSLEAWFGHGPAAAGHASQRPGGLDLPTWLRLDPRIERIEVLAGPTRPDESVRVAGAPGSPESAAAGNLGGFPGPDRRLIGTNWGVWTILVVPKGRVFKQASPDSR